MGSTRGIQERTLAHHHLRPAFLLPVSMFAEPRLGGSKFPARVRGERTATLTDGRDETIPICASHPLLQHPPPPPDTVCRFLPRIRIPGTSVAYPSCMPVCRREWGKWWRKLALGEYPVLAKMSGCLSASPLPHQCSQREAGVKIAHPCGCFVTLCGGPIPSDPQRGATPEGTARGGLSSCGHRSAKAGLDEPCFVCPGTALIVASAS